MKKYRYILVILFSTFLFASCEKETEGISKVTYYCELNLNDGAIVAIAKGSTFTDPGYTALENEEDVSDKVTVSGTVNTAAEGSYVLTYTVYNADGFPTTLSRRVVVYDNSDLNTTDNIEGAYNSTVLRNGSSLPASQQKVTPPWGINIVKLEDGVYHISDLLGGWYAIGRAYGSGYAGEGVILVKSDNTIKILWSQIKTWGSYVQSVGTSSYNPTTETLTLSTKMSDASYVFVSTMVIQ